MSDQEDGTICNGNQFAPELNPCEKNDEILIGSGSECQKTDNCIAKC